MRDLTPPADPARAGTFDEPGCFPIDRHIWTRSKLAWVVIPEGVPAFEKAYVPPA
jgi:hypothetical protein